MPEPDERAALRRAAEVLGGADEVALACHLNPDADALGSMLGLSNFLRGRGVATVCSYANEPFDQPRWVTHLPGADHLVPPAAFPASPAVMVTCDCASFDRLGVLGAAATNAQELIWIDHHRSNDGFGTIRLVDPDASSTCEMVFRLIDAMGGELDADVAVCLYAGLVTDTGRFQYQATTPETLRIAARLREHDFDHAALVRSMYEDNDPGFLRLLGTALGRMAEVPGASVVWTYLTQADLAEAGVAPGDTDDVIDVLRTARDVDVAAVLKQQRDGRFKVSVRSRGGHDLSAVASAFGGGGHRLAAGYTSEHGPEGTIERLVAALRQAPRHVVTAVGVEGLLLVDKPRGLTSHDVVDRVRRTLGTRKVGHAGTLDPMATGLLLIGVGRATRLLRFLGDLPKIYEGMFRLGVETDTLDADGDVIRESAVDVTKEQVVEAMRSLVGESLQRPPAYSAVKVGGRKLYEAARAGEQLEAEPRPIRVDGFDLLSFDPPDVTFRVICSGGTYVRVLAADVGAAVSTGAHLTALRRTAIGPYRAQDAISPDAVREPLAIEAAVGHLPRLDLEADEAEAASHGRPLGPAGIEGPYGVFGPDGRLIGVYEDDGPRARPQVILAS